MYDTRSYRSLLAVSGYLLFPFLLFFLFIFTLSCNYYNFLMDFLSLSDVEFFSFFFLHSLMSAVQLVIFESVLFTPCFIVIVLYKYVVSENRFPCSITYTEYNLIVAIFTMWALQLGPRRVYSLKNSNGLSRV